MIGNWNLQNPRRVPVLETILRAGPTAKVWCNSSLVSSGFLLVDVGQPKGLHTGGPLSFEFESKYLESLRMRRGIDQVIIFAVLMIARLSSQSSDIGVTRLLPFFSEFGRGHPHLCLEGTIERGQRCEPRV